MIEVAGQFTAMFGIINDIYQFGKNYKFELWMVF